MASDILSKSSDKPEAEERNAGRSSIDSGSDCPQDKGRLIQRTEASAPTQISKHISKDDDEDMWAAAEAELAKDATLLDDVLEAAEGLPQVASDASASRDQTLEKGISSLPTAFINVVPRSEESSISHNTNKIGEEINSETETASTVVSGECSLPCEPKQPARAATISYKRQPTTDKTTALASRRTASISYEPQRAVRDGQFSSRSLAWMLRTEGLPKQDSLKTTGTTIVRGCISTIYADCR